MSNANGVIVAAVLSGAVLFSTGAFAQQGCCQGGLAPAANIWTDGNYTSDHWPPNAAPATDSGSPILTKAAPVVEPVPYWWTHGEIEFGGRFFANDPLLNGSRYLQQDSLAKYYEYSRIAPGAFAGGHVAGGTSDGLYQVDLWANNVGYDDQSYLLTASKAGEQYLSVGWDQTPHLYSTSAQTFFQGVGTANLTLPPGMPQTTPPTINPFLFKTDIGIDRDTAYATYRWTPDEAWDVRVDYSHLQRTGTEVAGVLFVPVGNFPFAPVQTPRPVNDTTQNYGASGEYAGTSPWGKQYTLRLAYSGSTYQDDFTSYLVQDPFALRGGNTPFARESTWPSNNANAFSGTLGADLPGNSRYVGTLNYTMMRQNDAFIPMSFQNPTFPLPGSSLNGAINTLLSNNVLTTKITPELTSKLTYRYYNFDNETPQLFFPCQGAFAINCTTAWISNDQAVATEKQIQSLSMAYTKQNAGAELNWRPSLVWNLGAAYGYEQYDYTQVDATSTKQNSGKIYADWKPAIWFDARSSVYYSDRTASNYDYFANVGFIQFPGTTPAVNSDFFYNPGYRQFLIDNRKEWKAQFAVDVVAFRGVTLTPIFTYQDDYYGLNPATNEGLTDSKMWSAGVDAAIVISPNASLALGYMYENYSQFLYGLSSTSALAVVGVNGVFAANTDDKTIVNTFTAGLVYAAIPDKLDLSLRYALSRGVDELRLNLNNGATPSQGQFPNYTTWFQHLDAVATYTFDKATFAPLGWKGDVKAKFRYTWERNSIANWQDDPLAPLNPTMSSGANAIFMAYNNPNYNVHLITGSLIASW
jgi:MtrB/PioB family decaheme-associated outer membrane protein